MGAAVGVIGAVAGAAGTVANISAQQKQAQAQEDAIRAQEEAVKSNTTYSLLNIQRQKDYAKYMAEIDAARRNSLKSTDDMALQMAKMQEAIQFGMVGKQNEQQYALGNQRNEGMNKLSEMQIASNEQIGEMQLGNQYQIGSLMNSVDSTSAQNQLDLQYQGEGGNVEIGRQNAFLQSLGIDSQAAQANYGRQSQAFGVESQATAGATKVLTDVAQAFLNQKAQMKQNTRGRANLQAMMAGLGGGNDSRSAAAVLEDSLGDDLDAFMNTVMQGGRAAESALAQVGLSSKSADILRQLGSIEESTLQSQAQGSRDVADAQAGLQRSSLDAQYQNAGQDLAYKSKIGGLNIKQQYVLNQLALKDSAALGRMSNEEQYTLNKLALQSAMADTRLNLNDARQLNEVGYDAYASARDMQFGIESAQSELNKQFYDSNLSSSATTIRSSASSELQNLRAARSNISSPGILSYASAGLGAYQAINSGIQGMQQQQPRVNQQFGVSNQPINYTPGQVNAGFTGQNNYGVLSGYKLGGGF